MNRTTIRTHGLSSRLNDFESRLVTAHRNCITPKLQKLHGTKSLPSTQRNETISREGASATRKARASTKRHKQCLRVSLSTHQHKSPQFSPSDRNVTASENYADGIKHDKTRQQVRHNA